MKISDVQTTTFKYTSNKISDTDGHAHPGPEHDTTETLLKIISDDGAEGYWFGADSSVIENVVKPAIVGKDPLLREEIWYDLNERQRINSGTMTDRVLCSVDCALWDLAGNALGQPVYKLLGGYRDKVPAYASTMCGDDLNKGLATPNDYAKFAKWAMDRGYPSFKLHTWQPPCQGAPNPRRDIEACAAVRDAVGPKVPLMLDPLPLLRPRGRPPPRQRPRETRLLLDGGADGRTQHVLLHLADIADFPLHLRTRNLRRKNVRPCRVDKKQRL